VKTAKNTSTKKGRAGVSKIGIGQQLVLMTGVIVVGLLAVSVYSFRSQDRIKVNGPIYAEVVQGKDLVADILPPPAYIIESYLNTLQMLLLLESHGSDAEMRELLIKAKTLRTEFNARQAHWKANLPEGDLKEAMVEVSYEPALEFYKVRDQDFIPAVRAKNLELAKEIEETELKPAYEEHRKAIEEVVDLTNRRNIQSEVYAANVIGSTRTIQMILTAALVAIAVAGALLLHHSVSQRTGSA
jgi:methyl-accepting chemotaxis protein